MNTIKESNAAIETDAFSCLVPQERADGHHAEWHEPPALTLDELGMVQDCSKSGEMLFGCQCRDLVGLHVSSLFPQLSGVALVQRGRLNSLLNYNCRCGHTFHARNRQGDIFSSELSFVHLENDGRLTLRLILRPLSDAEA